MNIVEAVKAARERGFSVIALDYKNGFEMLRFTVGKAKRAERVNYPDGATGAEIFYCYSPGLDEILSDEWYLPNDPAYGLEGTGSDAAILYSDEHGPGGDIPPGEHKLKPGFLEPYTSETFKNVLTSATDYELAYALATLVDMLTRGAKVKRRVQAIQREEKRRAALYKKEMSANG